MNITPETIFTLLAHPLRLRGVVLLRHADELCVCDLTRILDVPQPLMSRHLAPLREGGVLTVRREGLWMYYRINPDLPAWGVSIIAGAMEGVADLLPYRNDRAALTDQRADACRSPKKMESCS
ncbi:MAG: metalloregulator ArsR/SmtB family transcription factor [Nitrospinae bacterium]|nr:metalloregulator ArsR/SmtB family transcription factor [Nitrospinota bacterium]